MQAKALSSDEESYYLNNFAANETMRQLDKHCVVDSVKLQDFVDSPSVASIIKILMLITRIRITWADDYGTPKKKDGSWRSPKL